MMKILFGGIAAAAGGAAAFQAASNAGLSARIGLGAALLVNTLLVLAGCVALWLAQGARTALFPAGTPWTLYLGGLFGFMIIAALAFVFPKIGAAHAVALMVLGQSLAALAIDHFGLLGMPVDPVTLRRAAGLALVAAGVIFMRW